MTAKPLLPCPERADIAERELERLRAMIWKYGKHLTVCTLNAVGCYSCSCGWSSIRETLSGAALPPTEREALNEQVAFYEDPIRGFGATLARADWWRDVAMRMGEYAKHPSRCDSTWSDLDCSCGLDELRAAIEEQTP